MDVLASSAFKGRGLFAGEYAAGIGHEEVGIPHVSGAVRRAQLHGEAVQPA